MNKTQAIKKLADKIEAAKRTYYNQSDELVITDAEYDALEDELRKLDPNHAALAHIGAAPSGGAWPKVKHQIPMGSLNKAQHDESGVEDELGDWFKSCGFKPGDDIMVTDKLDGISLSLQYKGRKLVQGLTRGDGTEGEDITRNVLLMKGAVKMLPPKMPDGTSTPDLVFVRGEVVCLKSDFAAHFVGESNPRNTAAGTSKRQSGADKCRFLTIKSYQLLPGGRGMASKSAEMEGLEGMGFQTPRWQVLTTESGVKALYKDYVDTIRDSLDYAIDGLVVEADSTLKRDALGEKNHRPKGAIAYKFPHEELTTILRNIRWQVGNSGRITPVAEFDMVQFAMAKVKQASLHNISNMESLVRDAGGIGTYPCDGDTILVARRNDVIPYVESIVKPASGSPVEFKPPDVCPECQTPLVRDGEYLVCRGDDCPAQVAGAIKRWVKKIGVLHVGDTLIEALIAAGMVSDIADLYLLDPDKAADVDINGRRAGGSAVKAITNLNKKKTLPIHVFVGALGIPLIGRSMAKMIVDGRYTSLHLMSQAYVADVAKIPGVGQTKAQSFVDGYLARLGLIAKLVSEAKITVQTATGPLVGQTFCLTGFRNADLSEALEKQGATEKSSVSKTLTYLIAADPNSQSGKAVKARQYGTKVISEDEAKTLAGL